MPSADPLRGSSGCLLVILLPFLLAGVMLFYFKASDAERIRQVVPEGTRTSWEGPDGPVLLDGTLSAGSDLAPGHEIAWASALRLARGKSTKTLCKEQSIKGLSLVLTDGKRLPLASLVEGEIQWDQVTIGDGPSLRIMTGNFHTFSPDTPGSVLETGAPLPCARQPGAHYSFQVLREGDPVRLLARRRGDSLAPADTGSILFTGPTLGLLRLSMPPGFFEFWLSFCAALLFAALSTARSPLFSDRKRVQ